MKLLYAEDEPAMSEAVVDILTFHHFTVDAVFMARVSFVVERIVCNFFFKLCTVAISLYPLYKLA